MRLVRPVKERALAPLDGQKTLGSSPDTTRPWGNRKLASWQMLPGCAARTAAQMASTSASPSPTTAGVDRGADGGGGLEHPSVCHLTFCHPIALLMLPTQD